MDLKNVGVHVEFRHVHEDVSVEASSVYFQAEDGIRDLVRSRGLGDVDKRQELGHLVMHDGIITGCKATEKQANYFASSFLMPRLGFFSAVESFPLVRLSLIHI